MQVLPVLLAFAFSTAVFCAATAPSAAQGPQSGPISIVVPFAAGGLSDRIARLLAAEFQKILGQTTRVENRPGGNGVLAAMEVARSAPNGNTLLLMTSAGSIHQSKSELTPIGMIGKSPYLLVARSATVASTKALLDRARQGTVQLAVDRGSVLAVTQFQIATNTKFAAVNYSAPAPALQDVVGGKIDAAFVNPSTVSGLLASGGLRLLAVSSAKRFPLFPDVPTLTEQGIERGVFEAWAGLAIRRGTPSEVVSNLSKALLAAASSSEFARGLEAIGYASTPTTPEGFASAVNEAGGVPTCGDPCPSDCKSGCDNGGCCVVRY
jgi:tripartite-type tricarboxylate transporter receptor subunit TctC